MISLSVYFSVWHNGTSVLLRQWKEILPWRDLKLWKCGSIRQMSRYLSSDRHSAPADSSIIICLNGTSKLWIDVISVSHVLTCSIFFPVWNTIFPGSPISITLLWSVPAGMSTMPSNASLPDRTTIRGSKANASEDSHTPRLRCRTGCPLEL